MSTDKQQTGYCKAFVAGEVRFVFDPKQTKSGSTQQDFSVTWDTGNGFPNQIIIRTYGELADQLSSVEKGDYVVGTGEIQEQRWQDPDTKEWHARHDITSFDLIVNPGNSADQSKPKESEEAFV